MQTNSHVRYPHDALIAADGSKVKPAKTAFDQSVDGLIEGARKAGFEDGFREGEKLWEHRFELSLWAISALAIVIVYLIFCLVTK